MEAVLTMRRGSLCLPCRSTIPTAPHTLSSADDCFAYVRGGSAIDVLVVLS